MTYDVKSVLSAWALTGDKILMHIAPNTALFADWPLMPLVISFHGFTLAVCASQAGSLSRLRVTNGFPFAVCASQTGSL
jgi:hypothetical protein